MKLVSYFTIFTTTTGLNCFTCTGRSIEKCVENGFGVTCLGNEEVCQVTQRKRDGEVYRVRMGCKQHRACDNNMKNNFFYGSDRHHPADQCRPSADVGIVSVCRQCCDGNQNCGLDLIRINGGLGPGRAVWDMNMATHVLTNPEVSKRRKFYKNIKKNDFDPNDSRYNGTITEYVKDPNDSRFNPVDSRHNDPDYTGHMISGSGYQPGHGW